MEKPKFQALERPKNEPEKFPVLEPKELDEICYLEVTDDEKRFFAQQFNSLGRDRQEVDKLFGLLYSLSGRPITKELPIQEATFTYKRNLKECEKLKRSVFGLLSKSAISVDQDAKKLEDASALLALESRKARWLEKNFYPKLFEKSIDLARAEVYQFLIRQKNAAKLDEFADIENIKINLKDELSYLADVNVLGSAGVYKGHEIDINIPPYYSPQDEWKIYLVAVHELLHHASYRGEGRIGIKESFSNQDFEELNEATTEILSYVVASDHLEKYKSHLEGQVKKLSLAEMAYQQYTFIVNNILPKIPMSYFTDAMLNKTGLDRLSKKFNEVFGGRQQLMKFAATLKNLYTPKIKAKAKGEQVAEKEERKGKRKRKVVSMKDYRKYRK
jgi:hypothetical protein